MADCSWPNPLAQKDRLRSIVAYSFLFVQDKIIMTSMFDFVKTVSWKGKKAGWDKAITDTFAANDVSVLP